MANSKSSTVFHEYATVDTSPGEAGYGTNEVSLRELRTKKKRIQDRVYFSVRETEADSSEASDTSSVNVRLQFKCKDDVGWQDYKFLNGATITAGCRFAITDMAAEIHWRGWVNDDDYVSGSVVFGFDW